MAIKRHKVSGYDSKEAIKEALTRPGRFQDPAKIENADNWLRGYKGTFSKWNDKYGEDAPIKNRVTQERKQELKQLESDIRSEFSKKKKNRK